MNKSRRKSNVILSFLIPYLFILVISICLWFVMNDQIIKIIEKQIIESNMMILEQGKEFMDNQLADVDDAIYRIFFDPTIKRFKFIKQPFYGPNVMRILDIRNQLVNYKLNNDLVLESFVLFKNNNIAINSEKIYKINELYGNFLKYRAMDYTAWYNKILNSYYNKYFLPEEEATLYGQEHSVITYVHSLGYPFSEQGAIVYLLDTDYIIGLFKGLDITQGGYLYIENGKGEIIASLASSEDVRIESIITNEKSGIIQDSSNGRMIFTYTVSGYNGWKYVVGQPMAIVKAKVLSLKKTHFVISICYLLLGIIVSYILAYRKSKPLQQVIEVIRKRIFKDQSSCNVYQLLENTVTTLINNNEELEDKLKQQLSFLKNAFFNNLFKGEFVSSQNIKSLATHVGLSVEHKFFTAIVLYFKEWEEENIDLNLSQLDFYRACINDIFEDIFGQSIYLHQMKANIIAILYSSDVQNEEEVRKVINHNLRQIVEQIRVLLGIHVVFGIGRVCENILGISRSYDEACQAINSNIWREKTDIIWYQETDQMDNYYFYPEDTEIRLFNHVKLGDRKAVKRILEELYIENFISRKLSIYMLQLFICDMYSSLIKLTKKLSIESNNIKLDIAVFFEDAHSVERIDYVYSEIVNYYDLLCDLVEKMKKDRDESIIAEMKLWIEEHFQDSGLNITMFADQFNHSESSISRFFKEHTFITFQEYLESIRMDYARDLLLNSDLSISYIAERSGYTSNSTFSRAFKRRFGVSASRYRSINRE